MNVHEAKLATLMAFTQEMQDGDPLFRQGDAGSELFVILNGSVRVYLEGKQGETTLAILETGTSLGEMALFRNTPRSASAAAVGPTKLLVINWEGLVKLQQRFPEIAALLFLNLARTLALNLNGTYARLIKQNRSQGQVAIAVEKTVGEINQKHLKVLKHYGHHTTLAVGRPLFDFKNPNKGLGLVLSGRMQVQSANPAAPAVLAERGPLEFVGDGALLPSGVAPVMVSVSAAEVEVLRFRAREFFKLVKEHPHTAAHLAQHLVQQLSDVQDAANSRLQAGGG
jgi:CRP-like cAMP-binding protein